MAFPVRYRLVGLLATGSWELPLVVIAAMLLVATLVYYFLVVPEPIELSV